MQNGSLINQVLADTTPIIPKVGEGATILSWSDRRPATVIEVSADGKSIRIQECAYTRMDKNYESESQDYTYTDDPQGPIHHVSLTKDGWKIDKGNKVVVGKRERYFDYSF